MTTRYAICQPWTESERGWGTRPDGYSLHLTDEDRRTFIKKYWDGMPDDPPEEYSRPEGTAFRCEITEEQHAELIKSECGTRSYDPYVSHMPKRA